MCSFGVVVPPLFLQYFKVKGLVSLIIGEFDMNFLWTSVYLL